MNYDQESNTVTVTKYLLQYADGDVGSFLYNNEAETSRVMCDGIKLVKVTITYELPKGDK